MSKLLIGCSMLMVSLWMAIPTQDNRAAMPSRSLMAALDRWRVCPCHDDDPHAVWNQWIKPMFGPRPWESKKEMALDAMNRYWIIYSEVDRTELAKRIPFYSTDFYEEIVANTNDFCLSDTFISNTVSGRDFAPGCYRRPESNPDKKLRGDLAGFGLSLLIAPDVMERKTDPGNLENLPLATIWLLDASAYLEYLERIPPTYGIWNPTL